MNTKDVMNDAAVIFHDVYGRGHGRDTTEQRFRDVLNMSEEEATQAFDDLVETEINEWLGR